MIHYLVTDMETRNETSTKLRMAWRTRNRHPLKWRKIRKEYGVRVVDDPSFSVVGMDVIVMSERSYKLREWRKTHRGS